MMSTAPWWQSLTTWVLVLLGWYAVHLATLSRERRKERRDAAKAMIDSLASLAIKAREFHTAAKFDEFAADDLTYKTDKTIRALQRPPLEGLDISVSKLVRLRKAITLKNADASSFATQPSPSAMLQDIRAAVDDLIDAIELAREAYWQ